MLAIGLMSGTSLDGVDAALVEITQNNYRLVDFVSVPYSVDFKERLMRNLNNQTARLNEISSLNFELGYKFVEAIDILLNKGKYKYNDISFVSSHGQTIWHDPHGKNSLTNTASTLQIGEPSVIAYATGIKTITNFRSMDIVAGGEGAPLVPIADYILYHNNQKNIVLQNIGGMSNLTFLKKDGNINDIISFDCGVGNVMIDYFCNKYFSLPYDKDGNIAKKGQVIKKVYEQLIKDSFIYQKPPKSTGREQYSQVYMDSLEATLEFEKYSKADIIATITEYTAYSMAYNYLNFLKDVDLVIVTGGGAHNKYLLERMQNLTKLEIITGKEYQIDVDAKEALAFVILGHRTLQNKPSNVCSVTGAKSQVILGSITTNEVKENE